MRNDRCTRPAARLASRTRPRVSRLSEREWAERAAAAVREGFASATAGASADCLARFHAEHKMALLAFDPAGARALGRIAAEGPATRERAERYRSRMEAVLASVPAPGRHVNVLQHLLGMVAPAASVERLVASDAIQAYAHGACSLGDAIALVRYALEAGAPAWALEQRYLDVALFA